MTAGSSGGTAAGLAANDALGGLGTDTGNSIRGPSSHNALVGIRSTQGLTSRDGIIPLFAHRDIGGPMTRTVEDAVRIFDVIAGIDPRRSRHGRGRRAPARDVHGFPPDPTWTVSASAFLRFEGTPDTNEQCIAGRAAEGLLRVGVQAAMADHDVDALVYPTWNNPPRLVGDLTSPHGNNSPILSPPTGFPAITVPMGFVWDDALPAGLQIYGDAWSEPILIRIAYAYEQATKRRRPPATAPPARLSAPAASPLG